ncbi:MAG: pyridoxal phosphate-dependent aminotransferase [Bacteriovoracaceae bacterium]
MKKHNNALDSFQETIFAVMSRKAIENKAINLSQGFPDFPGPEWLTELAAEAFASLKYQQYAPSPGILSLREELSKIYNDRYGLNYDPAHEVTIVNGATEGIFSSLIALLNPGDEVIIFEPYYDSYLASIKLAGAIPKIVTLHAPEFQYRSNELEEAFTDKTKLIILNTPHNPSGKVFKEDELKEIYNLALQNDCYILSDEVYEYLTYDLLKHQSIAQIEDAKERTLVVSSAGKTFGTTGWKVGWVMAPKALSKSLRLVHQFNTFSVSHASQVAVCKGLMKIDQYLPEFQFLYQRKRDFFLKGLQSLGFNTVTPDGTYFILASFEKFSQKNDVDFALELIEKYQVATIPPSAFYQNSNDGQKYLRFCFAKNDETLLNSLENLRKLK